MPSMTKKIQTIALALVALTALLVPTAMAGSSTNACSESGLLIHPGATAEFRAFIVEPGVYDYSLETWDDHTNGGAYLDPTQPEERVQVEFLINGAVHASTGVTADIPDDVDVGQTLYGQVTITSRTDTVAFRLISSGTTPDSVHARLCVTEASAPPTTTVPETTTTVPETTTSVPTTTTPSTTTPESTTTTSTPGVPTTTVVVTPPPVTVPQAPPATVVTRTPDFTG